MNMIIALLFIPIAFILGLVQMPEGKYQSTFECYCFLPERKPKMLESQISHITIERYVQSFGTGENLKAKLGYQLQALGLSNYETKLMIDIACGETTCGLYKYNPSGATGLFQILSMTWNDRNCIGNINDDYDNTVCAIRIYKSYGFSAWEWYNQNY